jgi:hypothetical protein
MNPQWEQLVTVWNSQAQIELNPIKHNNEFALWNSSPYGVGHSIKNIVFRLLKKTKKLEKKNTHF